MKKLGIFLIFIVLIFVLTGCKEKISKQDIIPRKTVETVLNNNSYPDKIEISSLTYYVSVDKTL